MTEWYRSAVVYEIYVRSFADSNGDGVGDLPGIRARLPYLRDLDVDGIWLTPFFPSPGADHGYDVADYVDVDPQFGTLADLDALVADAHALGLRVTIDVVPNHTSSEHPWFRNALADPAHPDRARYVFRPGRNGGPPNNWDSVFGGPAWTFDEPSGEYYLHLFAPEQPDLDWHNPQVQADFEDILRFWLDRGVDGFRIDVAHGLFKDRLLRPDPVAGRAARLRLHRRDALAADPGVLGERERRRPAGGRGLDARALPAALAWRRGTEALRCVGFAWRESPPGSLVFARGTADETVVCAVNVEAVALDLPEGELLLTSEAETADLLPPNSAVWVRLP